MDQTMQDATRADLQVLADALTRAFDDDPLTLWMLPDEATRLPRARRMWRSVVSNHLRRGHPAYCDEDRRVAALWSPPGEWRSPPSALVRALPAMVSSLRTRSLQAIRGFAQLEKAHPHDPHWYLAVLGTDTEHQGKGLGSAAMKPVLDRCDAEGVAAFLESSKESNVPFYERHGFRVTAEILFGKGGPPLWQMWRDPQPVEG